jgi:hypothetical protein
MAKRKDIEASSGAPAPAQAKRELPTVESPSISPAEPEPKVEPTIEPIAELPPAIAPVAETAPAGAAELAVAATPAPATVRRFAFNARHKRNALLAASVAIAAALGAVVGALASGGFAAPARIDVAGLQETKAMQQSIAAMAKEITTLKTSIEAANKSAHSQIAKINDKISERFDRASAEITGSIAAPQTAAPIPIPRPAPRIAAVETQLPARTLVVPGWSIRDTRDGYVYVEGHGDVYQVVPGAPLPGLGAVESIKRQDGRWVVTTPKGIIVSMRDRRYFESF